MTDTPAHGTYRMDAINYSADALHVARYGADVSNSVADNELCWFAELAVDALLEHPDLLQRLHDERLMTKAES